MVPFSMGTSYCFPVRLSVIVKVFSLMGLLLKGTDALGLRVQFRD